MSDISRKDILAAIQRVLAGDPDAYELIYRAHDATLRSYIGRRFRGLGDDFVSDVALRTDESAISRLDRYDPDRGASFQT